MMTVEQTRAGTRTEKMQDSRVASDEEPRHHAPGNAPDLHAHLAGFTHPRTSEKMRIESPIPAEFTAMMKTFEQVNSTQE